jgi:hypothetical protein
MGIIIPEGFYNASFIFTCTGSVRQKVTSLGIEVTSLTPPTPAALATSLRNIFIGGGRPFAAASMTDDYVFTGISVTRTVGGFPVIGTDMTPTAGTSAADSPPSNCAVIVKKVTAAGGRKNRGRLFVPVGVLGEASVDASGFMSAGSRTAYQTQWDAAFAAMVSADLHPALFHSSALAATPITAFSVESQIGTQRRRLR